MSWVCAIVERNESQCLGDIYLHADQQLDGSFEQFSNRCIWQAIALICKVSIAKMPGSYGSRKPAKCTLAAELSQPMQFSESSLAAVADAVDSGDTRNMSE